MTIPWTSLYSLPVRVNIHDVYVLAGPIVDRKYDARRETALANAVKKKKLADLERSNTAEEGEPSMVRHELGSLLIFELCFIHDSCRY